MSHVNKDRCDNTKSFNGFEISDTTRFFSSEEWSKMRKNPNVLKIIQDFTIRTNKEEDNKRRKYGNKNGTHNNSKMNTNITQAAIAELKTSQTDDNSIPTQVQMSRMVRQRGVNAVAT